MQLLLERRCGSYQRCHCCIHSAKRLSGQLSWSSQLSRKVRRETRHDLGARINLRVACRQSAPREATLAASPQQQPLRVREGRGKPSVRKVQDGVLHGARARAIKQLVRIQYDEAYAGRVSGKIQPVRSTTRTEERAAAADARDDRFVKHLVAGVTRWRRRLDFILDELTQHRLQQLDPVQQQVLRIGVYELVELGAPDHVINEHVDLVKRLVYAGAAGLTNGVLRSVVRKRANGTLPAPRVGTGATLEQRAEAIAIATSHPTWMVSRWLTRYGQPEAIELLAANNREPAHGVRLCAPQLQDNVPRLLADLAAVGVEAFESPLLPGEFLRVPAGSGLQTLLRRHVTDAAACQVQDEAAGLVVAMLDPEPGDCILDACAAPGGKTLFAASRMDGKGKIVALDRSELKLGALRASARLQGYSSIITTVAADLREYAQDFASAATGQSAAQPPFNKVLVDTPCSGLGVLAKRADLRWRREEDGFTELVALQDELLEAASKLVAPHGLLVYSTCSIEPLENQERIAAFLKRHTEFELEAPPHGAVPQGVLQGEYMVTLPHVHNIDGAFAARLRRVSQ